MMARPIDGRSPGRVSRSELYELARCATRRIAALALAKRAVPNSRTHGEKSDTSKGQQLVG